VAPGVNLWHAAGIEYEDLIGGSAPLGFLADLITAIVLVGPAPVY